MRRAIAIILLVGSVQIMVAQCDNADDYTALRALYLSTDGDNWTNGENAGWPNEATFLGNTSPPIGTDMSSWNGITCNGNNRVSQLSIVDASSGGTVPFEIGLLEELESLTLNLNNLSGTIPSSVGSLTNLTSLMFFDNSLSGSIPPELDNLVNLTVLELSMNNLSGPIPDFSNLTSVSYFNLGNNPLNTSIPSTLSNLNSVTFFILENCGLTGCLDQNLQNLCGTVTNGDISNNPSLATESWDDFCTFQTGICSDCPTDYTISYPIEACGFFNVEVTLFGGSPNYTVNLYEESEPGTLISSMVISDQVANFDVTPLSTGTYNYFVTIENAQGELCTDVTQLSGSEDIAFYTEGGFGVELPLESTCQCEPYNVTVNVNGGMPPYTVQLFENGNFISTQTGNGPNFVFELLGEVAGDFDYSSGVSDGLGCPYNAPLVVLPPHTVLPAPSANSIDPIVECQVGNEMVEVNLSFYNDSISLGNTVLWYFNSDGSFEIPNPGSFMTSASITVYARAQGLNECFSKIIPVSIVIESFTLECSSFENSINLVTTNASLPLDISWSGSISGSTTVNATSYTIVDLAPGEYTITVTDNVPCSQMCTVVVEETMCDHPDIPNLITLFNATNGNEWTNKQGWVQASQDENCDPCDGSWTGIDCDPLNQRVTGIYLIDNNLTGSMVLLPDLDSLQFLNLSNNDIRGGEWNFKNEKLKVIDVSNNRRLKTEIPNFNLPNLEELYTFNDSLFGGIPAFDSIPKIRQLFIYNNQFGGELNLHSLDSLRNISVFRCLLEGGLPDMVGSERLISLYADSNAFSGPLLDYSYLPELDTLLVRHNNLSGCMPPDVYCNENFGWFDATNNPDLAYDGDYEQLCDGMPEEGAPCQNMEGIITGEDCDCVIDNQCVLNVQDGLQVILQGGPISISAFVENTDCEEVSFEPTFIDTLFELNCDLVGTFDVTIYGENGVTGTTELTVIDIDTFTVDSILFPLDTLVTCLVGENLSSFEPGFIETNTTYVNPEIVPTYMEDSCSLVGWTYSDSIIYETLDSFEIVRTFTISEWTSQNTWEFEQVIQNKPCVVVSCGVSQMTNPCESLENGVIDVTITGAEDCTYEWYDSMNILVATTEDLDNVGAGEYTFVVRCDGIEACSLIETLDFIEVNPAINSTTLCDNTPDQISVQAGFDSYNWALDGNAISGNSNILTISQMGNYSVTVTSQGCEGTSSVEILNNETPSIAFIQDSVEVCNSSEDGSTIVNLTDVVASGMGLWSTTSGIDVSDPDNVNFNGIEEGNYPFVFVTSNAIPPCENVERTFVVVVISCSECAEGSCLKENPPEWIQDDDLVDITISCVEDIPDPGPLSYSNNQSDDCEISGEVVSIMDDTGFDGCSGEIIERWNYTTPCGDDIDPYERKITVEQSGIFEFLDTPEEDVNYDCGDVGMLDFDLEYVLNTGSDCIEGGSVSPVMAGAYDECGGTIILTWSLDTMCYDPLSFTQVVNVIANDSFAFNNLPQDVTISCEQLPFEAEILTVSNNLNQGCPIEVDVMPVPSTLDPDCPGSLVYTWVFMHPCTGDQISHVQNITIEDCPVPMLVEDYIEVRAGDIYSINLLENDFVPDSISLRLMEIDREALFAVRDLDLDGSFDFALSSSFFDTITVKYEVCNLRCDVCSEQELKIVDEALKDIFLTDIITPDGDGMNDVLKFNFEAEISDAQIYVYNRWGSLIFEQLGYKNDWDASGYPAGVYYYVLKIGDAEVKKTLTIVK